MKSVYGLDPGPTDSALVLFQDGQVMNHWYAANDGILSVLECAYDATLVIEKIASMGMAVGAEVFETCFWSGRFAQAYEAGPVERITRGEVKMNLCGSMRAKDANVRQAIVDRFGGKSKAIGSIKNKGPLYGMSGDKWSALAVALTWMDRQDLVSK